MKVKTLKVLNVFFTLKKLTENLKNYRLDNILFIFYYINTIFGHTENFAL